MTKKILLVEENQAISFLIETILEKKYTTRKVADSFFAMKELLSNRLFDLILISIDSSESDNFHLLKHIHSSSLLNNIPVIVLSNSTSTGFEIACRQLKIADYIRKPFDPLVLLKKATDITNKNTTEQQEQTRKKITLFNFSF
ncbi:N/A [soil metagenome]